MNNPTRKATDMRGVVDIARSGRIGTLVWRPALWVSYWNSRGGRADWGLRFNNPPVPSETTNSNGYQAWRAIAQLRPDRTDPHRLRESDDSMTRRFGTAFIAALMLWAVVLVPGTASAQVVASNPPATPQIGGSRTSGSDGTIERALQITQCGNTMYVGGTFTQVRNPGSQTPVTRRNAFAFSATSPYMITNWNPNVNGEVNTVACGTDGSVFVGGNFTNAGGAANRNLAKVNATTGASMPFSYHPAGRVAHVEVVQPRAGEFHLLVGGYFAGLLDSRNPVTGADDGYGTPAITGNYTDPDFPAAAHAARVWNMTPWLAPYNPATPTALQTRVLMTGVFNRVGGQAHEQIFRLDLTPTAATVHPWAPPELFRALLHPAAVLRPGRRLVARRQHDLHGDYGPAAARGVRDEPPARQRTGPCDATIAFSANLAPPRVCGSTTPAATPCSPWLPTRARSTPAATSAGRTPGRSARVGTPPTAVRGRSTSPGCRRSILRTARRNPARAVAAGWVRPTCSARRPGSGSPPTTRPTPPRVVDGPTGWGSASCPARRPDPVRPPAEPPPYHR